MDIEFKIEPTSNRCYECNHILPYINTDEHHIEIFINEFTNMDGIEDIELELLNIIQQLKNYRKLHQKED